MFINNKNKNNYTKTENNKELLQNITSNKFTTYKEKYIK
jgi:hypothetical protein